MKTKGLKKQIDAGYAAFLAKRKDASAIHNMNLRQQIKAGALAALRERKR